MFDLSSLWKKTVLEMMDEQILEEEYETPPVSSQIAEEESLMEVDSEPEVHNIHLRSSPDHVSKGWTQAHW